MRLLPSVPFLLSLAACIEKYGDDDTAGEESESDTDTDVDVDTDTDIDTAGSEAVLALDWEASGIVLTVTGGDPGGYWFGIVETDPASSDPWTGEDCYLGYTLSSGLTLAYCHPIRAGSNHFAYDGSAAALDEATETVFPASFREVTTYYLEENATGACWVWGHDPSYYDALPCTEL